MIEGNKSATYSSMPRYRTGRPQAVIQIKLDWWLLELDRLLRDQPRCAEHQVDWNLALIEAQESVTRLRQDMMLSVLENGACQEALPEGLLLVLVH